MILGSSLCIQIHLVVTIITPIILTNIAVLMFETICWIGKCCTFSFGAILEILAVPQSFLGHEPDG